MDKKVRFSVDSREVQEYQDKMRQSAKSMAADIISYARSQTSSAKETLQLIEEQIRAIEKRNKLDREIQIQSQRDLLNQGKITGQEFTRRVRSIDQETNGLNIQIALLRELIDTTKQTSREEIRANRDRATTRARSDFSTDELQNLGQINLRSQLIEGRPESRMPQGMNTGQLGQMASGLMSGNIGSFLTGFTALLGTAGIVAAIGAMAVNITRQYEEKTQSYAVASQLGISESISLAQSKRNSKLGLAGFQVMEKEAALMRSYGGFLNERVEGLLGAGISRGISDDALNRLMSVSRFSGTSGVGVISNFESFLDRMQRPMLRLPELLDSYLRKSDEILKRGGVLDSERLQQTLVSFSKSYNVESYNLDRMMNAITGAAGPMSKNPILESIKLQTLKELYPNKSMWERFGIMEHSAENPEYIQALITKLKGFGGGGSDQQKFMLANLLGLGYEDVNRLSSNQFNIERFDRAAGKSKETEVSDLSDFYEKSASQFVGSIKQLETTLGEVRDVVAKYTTEALEVGKNIARDLKTSNEDMKVNFDKVLMKIPAM